MFELSIACKYLLPRWRQLSVSIISIISVIVIALVVWLVVVFFSVTEGLEKNWIQKLIALTAPIRITPTDAYFNSHYYLIDTVSDEGGYATKTIAEKLAATKTDPYDPHYDEEIPTHWPQPHFNDDGTLKDLAKEAYSSINGSLKGVRGLAVNDFEVTFTTLKLQLQRQAEQHASPSAGGLLAQKQGTITHPVYLGSIDPGNPYLQKALMPPSDDDIANTPDPKERVHLLQNSVSSTKKIVLPASTAAGEGILLPKAFRDAGILVGDRGHLAYYSPTASSFQELLLPIFVAGFYDPGLVPLGNKFVLANASTTSIIAAAHNSEGGAGGANGIYVRFDDINDAEKIKGRLESAFEKRGLHDYWKVETFRDYEFTKDLLQQLRSEKNLFSIVACVVIIVACSNVISMLIILVNDKKIEIGILRSMGASSVSIALIFGLCGIIMGTVASVIGIAAAIVTLNNLQALVDLLSRLQGHQMFNPIFYGERLPAELSWPALAFVVMLTAAISMLAGVIPAVKAALVDPSKVLKAE